MDSMKRIPKKTRIERIVIEKTSTIPNLHSDLTFSTMKEANEFVTRIRDSLPQFGMNCMAVDFTIFFENKEEHLYSLGFNVNKEKIDLSKRIIEDLLNTRNDACVDEELQASIDDFLAKHSFA